MEPFRSPSDASASSSERPTLPLTSGMVGYVSYSSDHTYLPSDGGQRPISPPTLPALPDLPLSYTYQLVVCQQPLHARMCGFGEKDRRPIDPPPIVQLIVLDDRGQPNLEYVQNPFFVVHVTLWSEDKQSERSIIFNDPKFTRVLMGSLVSSPSLLKDTKGEQGCYFCFPDLSIRTEGRYTLKFSLIRLDSNSTLTERPPRTIADVYSDVFTVYSAKKFPGMTESTELSKTFARQGLKIPIRNENRPRKSQREEL